jgi:hypothetical protein
LEVSLSKFSTIFTAVFISIAITSIADAKHRHAFDRHVRTSRVIDANGNVVGRRPNGCPASFCGCEASRYLFGKVRPELNLASNWMRFPRAAPAPGMAAVRNHHVMVLMSHSGGNEWLVHDGNSGGGMTREHVRSINGYIIVDPQGSRSAAWLQGSSRQASTAP